MAEEQTGDIGIVTDVNDKILTIEIPRGGGCNNCAMHGLCGSGNTPIILQLETNETFQVGDKLIMEVSSGTRILAASIIFLLPLLFLIISYMITREFLSEILSVLVGFIVMALSFLLVRLIDRRIAHRINFKIGGKYEDLPE